MSVPTLKIPDLTVNVPASTTAEQRHLISVVAAEVYDTAYRAAFNAGFQGGYGYALEVVGLALPEFIAQRIAEDRALGPMAPVTEALAALTAAVVAPRITTKTIVREGGAIVSILEETK